MVAEKLSYDFQSEPIPIVAVIGGSELLRYDPRFI
jgi:hypothetical protein